MIAGTNKILVVCNARFDDRVTTSTGFTLFKYNQEGNERLRVMVKDLLHSPRTAPNDSSGSTDGVRGIRPVKALRAAVRKMSLMEEIQATRKPVSEAEVKRRTMSAKRINPYLSHMKKVIDYSFDK